MDKHRCVKCGAVLGDEDVMKVILEDGSCEVFHFSRCPNCFKQDLIKNLSQKIGSDDF